MTEIKPKFSWKIWGKKVLKVFLVGGVLSLLSFLIDTLTALPVDPQSVIYVTLALTILRAIENYLRHSD